MPCAARDVVVVVVIAAPVAVGAWAVVVDEGVEDVATLAVDVDADFVVEADSQSPNRDASSQTLSAAQFEHTSTHC